MKSTNMMTSQQMQERYRSLYYELFQNQSIYYQNARNLFAWEPLLSAYLVGQNIDLWNKWGAYWKEHDPFMKAGILLPNEAQCFYASAKHNIARKGFSSSEMYNMALRIATEIDMESPSVLDLFADSGILSWAIRYQKPNAQLLCVEKNTQASMWGKKALPEADWLTDAPEQTSADITLIFPSAQEIAKVNFPSLLRKHIPGSKNVFVVAPRSYEGVLTQIAREFGKEPKGKVLLGMNSDSWVAYKI